MSSLSRLTIAVFAVCVCCFLMNLCLGEAGVGVLTKESAKDKYGITMHAGKNGDAGIMVWIEFKKTGWLEKFTCAELQMDDGHGKHVLSARLQPNPIRKGQAKDVTTVALSVAREQLAQCSFLVMCYGSNEGDVGYVLKVKDFLDLKAQDFPALEFKDGPDVNAKTKL